MPGESRGDPPPDREAGRRKGLPRPKARPQGAFSWHGGTATRRVRGALAPDPTTGAAGE